MNEHAKNEAICLMKNAYKKAERINFLKDYIDCYILTDIGQAVKEKTNEEKSDDDYFVSNIRLFDAENTIVHTENAIASAQQ